MIWAALATSQAAADEILVAEVTCINPVSSSACTDLPDNTQVWWRVINRLGAFDTPFPGSNDLRDVTLTFTSEGGSSTTHWDTIAPAAIGVFGETTPFNASLVKQLVSLQLTATLSRTDFDPLFSSNPYLKFVADGPIVTGNSTHFPPPMDVFAQGQLVASPTPEPKTWVLMFVGLGVSGLGMVRGRSAVR
jgi:hypothetical protein